jgi:hypothetical protein
MSDFLDKAKEVSDTVRDQIADRPDQLPKTPGSKVEDLIPGDADGDGTTDAD